MSAAALLVELLTEELPPGSLLNLGGLFANGVSRRLRELGFGGRDDDISFVTPRRLAVLIFDVEDRQFEQQITRKGPSLAMALNRAGEPTQALIGFAKSCGVGIDALQKIHDAKGEFFAFRTVKGGEPLEEHLCGIVEAALKGLQIKKAMRWGAGDFEFVRPLHGLVMLHGSRVVPGTVFGISSGRETMAGRFFDQNPISIPEAGQYEELLEKAKLIPRFMKRFYEIKRQLREVSKGEAIAADDDLIEEVTGLVEHPAVYRGKFDPEFLKLPHECLVLSMTRHQKYFPLLDKDGSLLPRFLMVANVAPDDPGKIIQGNERVLRARLADAKFFYDQDRKKKLADRVPELDNVVYHNKLGSQLARAHRLEKLAREIAMRLGIDVGLAARAAQLCKADLLTDMVGEFPELQGVMGRYYAAHDGEPLVVADAIEAHYRPRCAGDVLPEGEVSICLALADKLETLAAMFGLGQQPSGDKDPFGLRRHAVGVVRILVEHELGLPIENLVTMAFSVFPTETLGVAEADLIGFVLERLRTYLREHGYGVNEVEAVLSLQPVRLNSIMRQLAAVRAFGDLPEAQSLAAANKRVANILKQAAAKGESFASAESDKLAEPAEQALFNALRTTSREAAPLFERGDFTGYLKTFAALKTPVDAFFDSVMVMTDDRILRQNRLGLLADLRREMNQVADISKLAA